METEVDTHDTNLGRNVASIRRKRRISQSELASQAGISQVALGYIENNERNPSIKTACALADALGVPLELLIK